MSEIEVKLKSLVYQEEDISVFWKMSDVNTDGTLSMEEFIQHFSQFLVSSSGALIESDLLKLMDLWGSQCESLVATIC